MKIKRMLIVTAALAFIAGLLCLNAFAADGSLTAYVTISDGTLVMAQEPVTVTDIDGDGALTINDALYAAHEAMYEGGAAAGYKSENSDYGLSLTKLWGVENGGSYGYYVNNASPMSLADPIKDGDYINAYIYTDTTGFSDTYCYFDSETVDAASGSAEITLTLSAAAYDENWNPVVKPVAGAIILVDGNATAFTTDADGKAVITLDLAKDAVISAKSDTQILVPPACTVKVSAVETPAVAEEPAIVPAPQTADGIIAVCVIFAAALTGCVITKKKVNGR